MPRFFFDLCQSDIKTELGSVEFPSSDLAREYANGLADVIFGRQGSGEQADSKTIVISDAGKKELSQVRAGKKQGSA